MDTFVPAEPTSTVFPFINACLNALSVFFLFLGYIFVRQRRLEAHKRTMILAFAFSALFLGCYLYYHFNYSSGRFGGEGWVRPLYFFILLSHIILAVVLLPFILRLLWLARQKAFTQHARLARIVWPVWMYISVTGVLVYLFLYQWYPQR